MRCEPGKCSTFYYYFQVVSGSAGKGLVIICHSDTIGILTVYTKSENIIHTGFFFCCCERGQDDEFSFAGNPAESRPQFKDTNMLATVLPFLNMSHSDKK